MSDRWVTAMAVAAALGARLSWPVPRWVAVALVAAALVRRVPWLLCAGCLALTASLAVDAWAGLDGVRAHQYRGTATLVSDPQRIGQLTRAALRIGHHRYEGWAAGSAGGALSRRLAGERIELAGHIGPLAAGARDRAAAGHLRGRVQIDQIGGWSSGDPISRAANRLRRALVRGAAPLPASERVLLTGFVFGDDRGQPPELVDDFRASGLGHLTAVSGQNVAFVLAVAAPALSVLGLRGRLVATLALLAFFALITRFEPSVLRACTMAALAASSRFSARPAGSMRLLALAVTVLLVIDPLLAHSVGFGLSVGASAGIIGLSRPLASRLRGPRFLVEPLSVTVGAQVGVLPLSLAVFGSVPLASIPANLLAAPAAGPVMMWGLTGGLAAGTFATGLAPLIHLPNQLLIGWIATVARVAARLPVGQLDGRSVAVLAGGAGVAFALRRRPILWVGALAVAAGACLAVGVGAALVQPQPAAGVALSSRARLWVGPRAEAVVVADRAASPGELAVALRHRAVRRVDVLVITGSPGARAPDLGPLLGRVRVRQVIEAGDEPFVVSAGDLTVDVSGAR